MQGMAEFMEEGFHLIEGQQCRFCLCRAGKVHNDCDVRPGVIAVFNPLAFEVVHPGTTLFPRTWVEVVIKYSQKSTVFIVNLIGNNFFVIYRYVGIGFKRDVEKIRSETENTIDDVA